MSKEFYEKYWQEEKRSTLNDRLTPKRLEIFFKEIKNHTNVKKILDAGCGVGQISKVLKEAGFEVTGIDISQQAINEARQNFSNVEFIRSSIDSRLPFNNESFDAIYCTEVIEHVYDTDTAIQEMARVLKRGGVLFISTPYHGLVKSLIIVLSKFERHFSPNKSHIRFFTVNTLKRMLRRKGFRVKKTFFLGRFWPVWMNMAMLAEKK